MSVLLGVEVVADWVDSSGGGGMDVDAKRDGAGVDDAWRWDGGFDVDAGGGGGGADVDAGGGGGRADVDGGGGGDVDFDGARPSVAGSIVAYAGAILKLFPPLKRKA